MDNASSGADVVDARRVAVALRELSFDLLRAMESAVPVALAEAAGDLTSERRRDIATRLFAETKARYAVGAAATLATLGSGGETATLGVQ